MDEGAARAKVARAKPAKASKINAWDLRELEGLPDAIAALEAKQVELAGKLADGSLYREAPAEVDRINGELAKLESELEEKFARWELLEARRDGTL
ncbi:ABC transporter ATP-binding protein uup [compost metagenome]